VAPNNTTTRILSFDVVKSCIIATKVVRSVKLCVNTLGPKREDARVPRVDFRPQRHQTHTWTWFLSLYNKKGTLVAVVQISTPLLCTGRPSSCCSDPSIEIKRHVDSGHIILFSPKSHYACELCLVRYMPSV